MKTARLFVADLSGLLLVQLCLLLMTILLPGGDIADAKVQFAWFLFALPGWLLAPRWTGRSAGIAAHYSHAIIIGFVIHAWLALVAFIVDANYAAYQIAFALLIIFAATDRWRKLAVLGRHRRLNVPARDAVIWLALMFFVVIVFRMPRSNDIQQFLLQQQDMLANTSFQPSSIGMTAMDVAEPMPRWKAQYWHVFPCLIAHTSGLPVRGVLERWLSIPLAWSVIVTLIYVARRLAPPRTPLWCIVLALVGPIILWHRSFNAFTYAFRFTNNFCLDKDFCLFFLLPVQVYLATRWLQGIRFCGVLILLLLPATLKFHPMTAVYFVLLMPFILLGFTGRRRSTDQGDNGALSFFAPWRSAAALSMFAVLQFVAVFLIGDAQTFHKQIAQIIRMDFEDSQTGRPTHYWGGHYAAIPNRPFELDTTSWVNEQLQLRSSLATGCSLTLAAHAACLLWGLATLCFRWRYRRWLACTGSLAVFWGIWLLSGPFLTKFPHYLAGYERLHWFLFLPCLIAVASATNACCQSASVFASEAFTTKANRFASTALILLMIYSGWCYGEKTPTALVHIRGMNSLLDYMIPEHQTLLNSYNLRTETRPLVESYPSFINHADRVLLLDINGTQDYWLIRQGLFWSEPYAEAMAFARHGDKFLEDRSFFYALLDRVYGIETKDSKPDATHSLALKAWLSKKKVTVIVDRREGADEYFEHLNEQFNLEMSRSQPGVWRFSMRD